MFQIQLHSKVQYQMKNQKSKLIYLDQILSEAIEAEERKRAEIAAKRLAAKERRAARKAGTIKELIAGVNQAQDKFDKVI